MLEKIVSGGQTGADQGGLEAAEELGIPTGGWIPRGFLTENGDDPSLGERFGLIEHINRSYVPRTYDNVRDSDGTIVISGDWSSAGTICTLKAIMKYEKPRVEVSVTDDCEILDIESSVDLVRQWIMEDQIKILNVAGNRESKCPGIQNLVKEYLLQVLS